MTCLRNFGALAALVAVLVTNGISAAKERHTNATRIIKLGSVKVIVSQNPPMVFFVPKNPKNRIFYFVSPSCNHCARLYKNTAIAQKNRNKTLQTAAWGYALYPRSKSDFAVIQTLMCVEPERIPLAVNFYFLELYRRTNGAQVSDRMARSLAAEVASKYGADRTQQSFCLRSKSFKRSLELIHLLGARVTSSKNVPIIMLNGKTTKLGSFFDVQLSLE